MLSISKPLKGAGAASYYLELSQEDYYLKATEAPGQWVGHGAALLGLPGRVQGDDLRHLMAGRSPDGAHQLVQNAGVADRQSGWDLTFSAPKSVSVLWALAPAAARKKIEAIQQHSVETALAHLEETAALTRRGRGGKTVEPAATMFATFQHRTSRAKDPQLHTHAVLVNLGLRQDGTTGTLLSQPFFKQKMALGALYRTELAAGLQRELGLILEPEAVGFRVEGVPQSLCRHFSKRRQQIEQRLKELRKDGAVAAKIAALDTRTRKDATASENLFIAWRETGEAWGWGQQQASGLLHASVEKQDKSSRLEQERAGTVTGAAAKTLEPSEGMPLAASARAQHEAGGRTAEARTREQPQGAGGTQTPAERRDKRPEFGEDQARERKAKTPDEREPARVLAAAPPRVVSREADANKGEVRRREQPEARGLTRTPAERQNKSPRFEEEIAAAVAANTPDSLRPGKVLPLAAQAAVRHGKDARRLLESVAGAIGRAWPRMPRWLKVEWHRVYDSTPWIQPRKAFLYTESFQPFPRAWLRPVREFRLRRLRMELPRLRIGSDRRCFKPQWWRIHWKQRFPVGELRVQQRYLFRRASMWSPLHGLSLYAVRFTPRHSKLVAGQRYRALEKAHML